LKCLAAAIAPRRRAGKRGAQEMAARVVRRVIALANGRGRACGISASRAATTASSTGDFRLVDGRIEFRTRRDSRGSKAEALGRTEFTTSEHSSHRSNG